MRMKIYSCLLVFVLGCNVSAEIKHKIIRQEDSVTLPCPHPVEGKVMWSRESNGNRVDILTVDGDGDRTHIHDPSKRYSSSADNSLHISRAALSDTGTYFCNNEPAVQLTVIKGHNVPPPPTTTTPPATTSIPPLLPTTILSPPSPPPETSTTPSPPTTIRTTSEPLAAATTAPSTPLNTAAPSLRTTVRMGIVILCLVIMISITVITWRKAQQKPKQHTTETENDL